MAWIRKIPAVDRKITTLIEILVLVYLFIHLGGWPWLVHSIHFVLNYHG